MNAVQQPVSRFVLLCTPRTGSNLLCTLLDSHPDILCHHEIFNPSGIFYALHLRDKGFSLGSMEERQNDPLEFMQRIWKYRFGCTHIGFKLNRHQNPQVLHTVLEDRQIRKVILKRRNRVKAFVSWLVAESVNQWEVYRDEDLVKNRPRVEVDVPALLDNISYCKNYYSEVQEALETSGQACFSLYYEDLFNISEQQRLLEFLEVDSRGIELTFRSVKQNPDNLREIVSNYSELESALRGSELESELHSI